MTGAATLTQVPSYSRRSGIEIPGLGVRAMTVGELAELAAPEPLIDGLLYRNTLAEVYGPAGSFKSFIALSWALSIASGHSGRGLVIPQARSVVYVAAEGASGMRSRVEAWCQAYGVDQSELGSFLVIPEPVQLQETAMLSLIAAVGHIEPGLVVFDTRARSTVGMEENSSKEMGQAIAAADLLRRDTGATVLTVHHSGRNGGASRGSSAWPGAVWSELEVKRHGHEMAATVKVMKHKDVEDGNSVRYALQPMGSSLAAFPEVSAHPYAAQFSQIPDDGLPQADVIELLMAAGCGSRQTAYRLIGTHCRTEGEQRRKIVFRK